jgi:citronellol/citronellal dehydrogenase
MQFDNKTAIVTGSSRGIGREIALKLASLGANVVLAAKTVSPHPLLKGTIESVAKEINLQGGNAMPFQIDVREHDAINLLVAKAFEQFKSIDILVNNAGAIYLTDTINTEVKQFDLMHQVNARATFLLSKAAIPYLAKQGGHILNLSPPIDLDKKWLSPHVAYTMSKYGMSMCTLAMAEEFKEKNIAVNSLWPKTLIDTAAVVRLLGEDTRKHCRKPAIMADAAAWIFAQNPCDITGNLFYDEDIIKRSGINDINSYACESHEKLFPDLYVS